MGNFGPLIFIKIYNSKIGSVVEIIFNRNLKLNKDA